MKPILEQSLIALLMVVSSTRVSGQDDSRRIASSNPAASDWTVMIYMNANNNLEPDAFGNFAELAGVDLNPAVNVIVQFARQAEYTPSPYWKGAFAVQDAKRHRTDA